jgi:UDP-N-acetylglucosamine 4-epimerase
MRENGIQYTQDPIYRAPRGGDVVHSQASIKKAQTFLGYKPSMSVIEGLKIAMPWYINSRRDLT